MAASSVTGVGPGSADGLNKGSEHMSLAVEKLIGTHMVASGSVTLSGGAGTVVFPKPLSGSKAGYFVFVQSLASLARPNVLTNDSSGNFSQFTVAGTGTDTVQWHVIKL
jgi:hypothetical protein